MQDISFWLKFFKHRLDVKNRCTVDGIQHLHPYRTSLVFHQLYSAEADPVGSVLGTLGKEAHVGKVGVIAGMAGVDDVIVSQLMEIVYDLEVRESFDVVEGSFGNLVCENDLRDDFAPVVIGYGGPVVSDSSDGMESD